MCVGETERMLRPVVTSATAWRRKSRQRRNDARCKDECVQGRTGRGEVIHRLIGLTYAALYGEYRSCSGEDRGEASADW